MSLCRFTQRECQKQTHHALSKVLVSKSMVLMLEFMNNLYPHPNEIKVGIVSFGRYLATKVGRWMGVKGKTKMSKGTFVSELQCY